MSISNLAVILRPSTNQAAINIPFNFYPIMLKVGAGFVGTACSLSDGGFNAKIYDCASPDEVDLSNHIGDIKKNTGDVTTFNFHFQNGLCFVSGVNHGVSICWS